MLFFQGYVTLSGRIKEIIITSGGENIGPVQIEDVIKEELPCLSNAMVCIIIGFLGFRLGLED